MYPIDLIAFGKLRLKPCHELERHYVEMLRGFARLSIHELLEGKGTLVSRQLNEEAQRLRPRLQAVQCAVLLTPEGKLQSSESFAQWLGNRMDRGESLAFALGSSHGFDPALKTEFREQISLSPMTFPHELSRVMFLEQLYRAFSILKGKAYHK